MKPVPFIPASAPFNPRQRAWINGWLTGMFSDAQEENPANDPPSDPAPATPLLILFGSQSGTAQGLAKSLAKEAASHGFAPHVAELNDYENAGFARAQHAAILTSTWGDGDPPDNADRFWAFLAEDNAPRLDHLNYSVLALGDSSYSDFCGAGRKMDDRLQQLGARRVAPRADCDLDYESPARAWMDAFWKAMKALAPAETVTAGSTASAQPAPAIGSAGLNSPSPANLGFDRHRPFPAQLLKNVRLNAPQSSKDTRHFEICLADSGLEYEVGDALGVRPVNCNELVNDILSALGCDGEEAVPVPDHGETALRKALLHHYAITQPPPSFLQEVAVRTGDDALRKLLDPGQRDALTQWLWGREIIDVLSAYPHLQFTAAEFVSLLRKLQPRLYSISSSPKAHPGQVHLTVASVRYESLGRRRKGVCSTFLADRVELRKTPVPVFVQESHGFRLPRSGDTPIIMVGPGTGVAPFRAFLEERRAVGAPGRNWLFFGDQTRACDFLYEEELKAMLDEGTLEQLDTAFSRDQKEKIYVQHRLKEKGADVWQWLEEGAHFYVCGDAKRMAKDVDRALHDIVAQEGGKSAEQAAAYIAQMKSDKRYQRDVY